MERKRPVLSHDPKEVARIQTRLNEIEQEQAKLEKDNPNIPFAGLYYGDGTSPAVFFALTEKQKEIYQTWHRLENEHVRLSTPVI